MSLILNGFSPLRQAFSQYFEGSFDKCRESFKGLQKIMAVIWSQSLDGRGTQDLKVEL